MTIPLPPKDPMGNAFSAIDGLVEQQRQNMLADKFPQPWHSQQQGKASASGHSVETTLSQRGDLYGPFMGHAAITQELKKVTRLHLVAREKKLSDSQQEALDMIFHKIGRIINGDANYSDSWHDIAGYATLVEKELEGKGI